jgi:hypothetical protein
MVVWDRRAEPPTAPSVPSSFIADQQKGYKCVVETHHIRQLWPELTNPTVVDSHHQGTKHLSDMLQLPRRTVCTDDLCSLDIR